MSFWSSRTTVYNIQNVNIHLTAEVVKQLNMNPKQVVNLIRDRLREELDNAVKKGIQPEEQNPDP